eukprot:TRINITY_DN12013_c0_g1_i1.p1 TRINITY_DN12013_c0_g1~~TRINITY_DN12013_c0_g1_i1.p1  ORF type:complete len:118 (+),score=21.52 TRINITY_DN12013_c0_g1_i1:512-865(+)
MSKASILVTDRATATPLADVAADDDLVTDGFGADKPLEAFRSKSQHKRKQEMIDSFNNDSQRLLKAMDPTQEQRASALLAQSGFRRASSQSIAHYCSRQQPTQICRWKRPPRLRCTS